MIIKKMILLLKVLNIILNFIFGINFFKLDFIDYFSTVNEFKIKKGIEIEDTPLEKRDKVQLKIVLVLLGSFFTVIGIVIFLIKIGEDGSNASNIINTTTSNIKNDIMNTATFNIKNTEGNGNISSKSTCLADEVD